ncbi:MAG: ABC transporter substrate-binding protein [Planctomycetota bacterium]|nr:ABC transporter substrate-binding protein [Planctomycetota bacterium]
MSHEPHHDSLTRREAMSRVGVGALGVGALGFAFFGPRGRKETSGRLVLDYWEKWTGEEGAAMQRVVDAFNNSQSRILVRYFATAGIDQKTLVAIAGRSPPDVVGLWAYNVPAFAESGAIVPLDELGEPLGVRLENYALGMRPIMTHGRHQASEGENAGSQKTRMWATINTGGTLALYFNRGAFREVGLDPDRPPRTISELDAFHRKLVRREGDKGPLTRAGFLHREPGWWSWIWGYHFGGSLFDASTETCSIDDPRNVQAFEWVQSYSRELGLGELERFRGGFGTYASPLNAFLAGKVAMIVQGPWLANILRDYAPGLDYGVAPFPVADGLWQEQAPIGAIDTDVLVIPSGVRHPEASMEFIAFTQRQEQVEMLSLAHCKSSPLATSSEDFFARHANRGVRVHDALAKSERSFLCPRTRTWPFIKDTLDATMDRVSNLRGEPAEILRDVQRICQRAVDRGVDERIRRQRGRGIA